MEGAPAKHKGRRRPAERPAAGATGAAAAGAATGARPAATAATDPTAGATELTEAAGGTPQPKPSLSQRVVPSIQQLSQLGTESETEEAGEMDEWCDLAGDPALPEDAAAAKDKAEEEEARDWANGLGRAGQPAGEEEEAGQRLGPVHLQLLHPATGAAAQGRRLLALRPAGRLERSASDWRLGAAVLLAVLALLCGLQAARQAQANGRELSELRGQVFGQLDTTGKERAKLSGQLAEMQRELAALDSRQAATAAGLQALQASCKAGVWVSTELGAELAAARADVAGLQAAIAAAAREAAAQAPRGVDQRRGAQLPTPAARLDEERVRQLAKEEAGAELDLFAADRTGQPDWAQGAVWAAVVGHSQARRPPAVGWARFHGIREKMASGIGGWDGVHPLANKLLTGLVAQPGACLPLVGSSGWVDVRLAGRIRPSAFTYEHISHSIAYDIRTAPRNLTLLGFLGRPPTAPTEGGTRAKGAPGAAPSINGAVQLGSFAFDAHARRAVQTFPLSPEAGSGSSSQQPGTAHGPPLVDHIRLLIASNHGHPDYTCVYRLRMHGEGSWT